MSDEKLIENAEEAWGASRERLAYTYLKMAGEPLPENISDPVAQLRVRALISRANKSVGQNAVPETSIAGSGEGEKQVKNDYKEGTLAKKLADEIKEESTPRVAVKNTSGRRTVQRVVFSDEGTSNLQLGSVRSSVYELIRSHGLGGVEISKLDEQAGFSTRGHVQKLMEKGHVTEFVEGK